MVTVKAATLCGSVIDSIAVFGSEILVGLERIGVKPDGVGVVVMSFDFFVVMVVRY